uniref:Ycf54 n=1 Tax=Bostrychia tenella TaxID=324755 RepID=A0A1Z1M5F4_9FLOR|nr:hypothetical protein [Bostrychia tenella]ARW61162.1 hypothetical protein [Bostrychia tenella]
MYDYYFALASKNFLLSQEPVEEILRERTQYYKANDKEIDFWFVINPGFVYSLKFKNELLCISDSFAAIISLDQQFIQWLKLRIGFVQIGSFQSQSIFIPNVKKI